jgi:hypothetical protein
VLVVDVGGSISNSILYPAARIEEGRTIDIDHSMFYGLYSNTVAWRCSCRM